MARIHLNERIAESISFMSKKLSRKGVADLEKLATAVYVNHKLGPESAVERRADFLTDLKPHVSVEAARGAFAEVEAIEEEARRSGVVAAV